MCVFQKFEVEFGPDEKPPPLADEWLEQPQNHGVGQPSGSQDPVTAAAQQGF
jgi:hypothetical protein